MTSKRTTLPLKLAELSIAAPQVMAHRLSRMAASGASPSASDQREMQLMGAEKVMAFWESWGAMAWQTWAAQQRAFLDMQTSLWRSAFTPFAAARSPQAWMKHGATQWQNAALDVLAHGLTPVHRRALANSKRLSGRTVKR